MTSLPTNLHAYTSQNGGRICSRAGRAKHTERCANSARAWGYLVFTIVGYCLLAPAPSLAQVLPNGCRQQLLEESGGLPNRYQPRLDGLYCDGTVPIRHKGELGLVSLTLGPVAFPESGSRLVISRPAVEMEGKLYVRGEDKRPGKSYRLDGTIPVDGLAVDLDAAIRAKGIDDEHLGLVAWTETPDGELYLPISAGTDPTAAKEVILVVRTSAAVIQAAKQICALETDSCRPQEVVTGTDSLPAGGLIRVPIACTNLSQNLRVKLTTLGPGNILRAAVVKLIIPPRHD